MRKLVWLTLSLMMFVYPQSGRGEEDVLRRLERLEKALEESQVREKAMQEKIDRLEQGQAEKASPVTPQPTPVPFRDRPLDWQGKESPFTPLDRTLGSDLPAAPATEQNRFVESNPEPNLVERLRRHEGSVGDSYLFQGWDVQGFLDARFIFDEDILFDSIESFNFEVHEFEVDIIKRFPRLAYMRADVQFSTIPGQEVQVEQAYAGLNMPWWGGFDVRFGKMNSPIGTEGVDAPTRILVSPSLVHVLAMPENLLGLQIMAEPLDYARAFFIITNGWDLNQDNNEGKSVLGRLEIFPVDDFTFGVSGGIGPEQFQGESHTRQYIMVDSMFTPHPRWDLSFDWSYGWEDHDIVGFAPNGMPIIADSNWLGTQVTALFRLWRWFDLAGRYEFFWDDSSARITDVPGVRSLTSAYPGQTIFVHSYSQLFRTHLTEGADLNIEYQFNISPERVFRGLDGILDGQENVVTFQFAYVY